MSRLALEPGTVVWARIPYADEPEDGKSRPAVVHDVAGREVRLHAVTSSTKESVRRSDLYVNLVDWSAAGLNRPSLVDRRLVSVGLIAVSSIAGQLAPQDYARVFDPDDAAR